MRKKRLILANWKANPATLKEAVSLVQKIERGISLNRRAEVVIAPPYSFIHPLGRVIKKIKLGAQNCFFSGGPYTGEIAPRQLKGLGIKYVIVGHSERKIHLGETDELINKKVKALLENGLLPVLCVGEKERKDEQIPGVVGEQLKNALRGVSASSSRNLTVAYEPVWAISTMPGSRPDTPENAVEARLYIRRVLSNLLGRKSAGAIRVIYGGSVKAANVSSFVNLAGMEGVLVGGASLNADEFIKVVALASKP